MVKRNQVILLFIFINLITHNVFAQILEEITVTATRRASSLQDLSASVTAFNEDTLNSLNINDANELSIYTPGLTINQGFSTTSPIFTLRGISNFGFTSNFSSSVAIYADEILLNNNVAHGVQMFDLKQVEVLKGPQGTLYGANTTGGAVNFIANKPQEEFSAKLDFTYAEYDEIDVQGYVNLPLSEKVKMRVSTQYRENDGYLKDLATGEDRQNFEQTSIRAQLLADVTNDVSILLRADYAENDGDASYGKQLGTIEPTGGVTGFDAVFLIPVGFTRCSDPAILQGRCVDFGGYSHDAESSDFYSGRYDVTDGFEKSESWGISSTIDWKIGGGTLRSLTHYREDERQYLEDSDAGPFDLVTSQFDSASDQVTQELRFSSDPNKRFRYILGGFYMNADVESFFPTFSFRTLPASLAALPLVDAFGIITGTPGTQIAPSVGTTGVAQGFFNLINQNTETIAVFADGNFDINDRLTFSGGIRYTSEKRKATSLYQDIGFPGLALDPNIPLSLNDVIGTGFFLDRTVSDKETFKEVTGRATLEYKFTEEILGYAGYSRSFKSGNINGLALGFGADDGLYLDSEFVDGIEIGVKSTLWDGKARFNAAGYYYKFKGQQLNSTLNQSAVLTNIETSDILGLEVELQLQLTDRLYLQSGLSAIDSEYGNLINNRGRDISGFKLARTPPYSIHALAQYDIPLKELGNLSLQMNINWRDELYTDPGTPDLTVVPPVTLLGARVEYRTLNDKYSIAVWGKNLLEEEYFNASIDFTDFSGSALRILAPPRTIGVSVSASFE
jgi:iron complex outermembrane recepter protein